MPRPMIPAPMTAIVRTSAIELCSLFQLLDDGEEVRVRGAHVFGKALLLVAGDQVETCANAAKRRRDIVHVVHHANQFTSSSHRNPFKRMYPKRGNNAVLFRQCCAKAVCTEHGFKNRTSFYSRCPSGLSKGVEFDMAWVRVARDLRRRNARAWASCYAAKSSLAFPSPCSTCDGGCCRLSSRSVISTRAASLDASSGVSAPARRRHDQLPSIWPGTFIRASEPRPKTSCTGMIARFATEVSAARMNAQLTPSLPIPR